MKVCPRCDETKPLDEYHRNRSRSDGRCRYCKPCKSEQNRESYHRHRDKRLKDMKRYRQENPEKIAAAKRKYARENREAIRERWNRWAAETGYHRRHSLGRRYGITPEDYERMLDQQDGGCAICHRKPGDDLNTDVLFVDHDHDTDEVRGLLCPSCNAALGSLGDSVEGLQRAIAYLEGSA